MAAGFSAAGRSQDTHDSSSGVTAMGTMVSEDVLTASPRAPREFYGRSSAVSFLKEAYGPLGSTSPRNGNAVRQEEARVHQTRDIFAAYSNLEKFHLPPRPVADHFVQRYFERVYYLYPFFDRGAFEAAYQRLWQPGNPPTNNNNTAIEPNLGVGSYPRR